MYKRLFFYFTINLILLTSSVTFAQISAKIGEEPFTKNRSAVLEIQSANRGFLPPRMTHTQMNQIASPATGLIVYCTNCGPTSGQYRYFNGLEWVLFTGENSQTIGYPILGITTNIAPTNNSLTVASIVLEEGTYSITSRGFVSTSNSNVTPTLTDRITQFSTQPGTGSFSTTITNLAEGTTYNLRAYATVSSGTETYTAFSNLITVTTTGTAIPTVTSKTGRVWMDRNLGATQVAQSSTDTESYGDYYQWGRKADGHEKSNSGTITSLSPSNEVPASYSNKFIKSTTAPNDWISSQNSNLWQGVNGINNPCPSGFRVPTSTEFGNEITAYSITTIATAFASILKLPAPGNRDVNNGNIPGPGGSCYYWTSTTTLTQSFRFTTVPTLPTLITTAFNRGWGMSVRCIKD
jgi:hypothetical protein